MNKVYRDGNYVIVEVNSRQLPFAVDDTHYNEIHGGHSIKNEQNSLKYSWLDSNVGDWFNEAGDTAYTVETLVTFLRENTGFNTPEATGVTGETTLLDTTNFNNNLSAADTNVQLALETLDEAVSSSAINVVQQVDVFSNLIPGTLTGDLAYVEQSEGTQWLPGTIGGTYYPKGFYLWNAAVWTSDRNAIAEALGDSVTSIVTGEPIGSDVVVNIVSLTQAEHDAGVIAGTIKTTTIYPITDA